MSTLAFDRLRAVNATRSVRYYAAGQEPWTLDDWMTALGGEVGEALNLIKKLNRDRMGMRGNTEGFARLLGSIGSELSDVAIYLDLTMLAGGLHPFGANEFAAGSMRAPRPEIALSRLGRSMLIEAGRFAEVLIMPVGEIEPSKARSNYEDAARGAALQLMIRVGMVAASLGIDLGEAIASKFNATSEKLGFPERL